MCWIYSNGQRDRPTRPRVSTSGPFTKWPDHENYQCTKKFYETSLLNIINTHEHVLQKYLSQWVFDNSANSSCDKLVSGDMSLGAVSGSHGKGGKIGLWHFRCGARRCGALCKHPDQACSLQRSSKGHLTPQKCLVNFGRTCCWQAGTRPNISSQWGHSPASEPWSLPVGSLLGRKRESRVSLEIMWAAT